MAEHTRPNDVTRAEEAAEARQPAGPGPLPTEEEEEEEAADGNQLDPDVAVHEKEMIERGAHQQGEGRLP